MTDTVRFFRVGAITPLAGQQSLPVGVSCTECALVRLGLCHVSYVNPTRFWLRIVNELPSTGLPD
jgi:hypothetical protein